MRRSGEYRSHAPREAVTSAWKRTSSSLPPGPMAMALGNQVAPRIRKAAPHSQSEAINIGTGATVCRRFAMTAVARGSP